MKRFIPIIILFFLVILPSIILAQPGLPDSPDQTPIDGGIIWMLIAGGAYGIKKLRDDNTKT